MAIHGSAGRFGRRQFVKTAAVGVGAGSLLPLLNSPAARAAQTPPGDQSGMVGRVSVPDPRAFAGTEINLAVQEHTATDAIRELSPSFEEQTGITVNFEQIPQQQMNQKQLTDLSTGTGTYDVIGWFINPEYIENGWIESVDELSQDPASTDQSLLALDDFYQPFLDWYRYQGVLYGLPFYGESIMMYYNTEEFDRAGITKVPETVEELEATCQAITEGGRMAGMALRASQEGNAAIYPFLGWLYGYGGFWADATTGEIGLNKPESIEAAAAWGHFLRDYGPADVASYFWNEVQLAMQQERVAIIMDATNFAPRLEDSSQSKVAGKVGYALLPMAIGPDGPRGPEQTGGRFGNPALAYGLSVPTSAKNKQAAWLFNQWATSPAVMLETTQIGLRGDPTRQSSLTAPQFIDKYSFGGGSWVEALSDSFGLAMPTYWPRDVITQAQLADVLGLALSQIVTGERSAEEAMTEAYDQSVEIQQQAGLLD